MSHHAGRATLLQLLALVPITIAGLVVYWSVSARINSKPMMRPSVMLRDIQAGMLTHAQSNNGWLPGLDGEGAPLPNGELTANSGAGDAVAARFRLLAAEGYVPSTAFIDPRDSFTPWTAGPLTPGQYSYAMLDISTANGGAGARRFSWRDTSDSRTALLSDRNTSAGATPNADAAVRSLWTSAPGSWHGYVAWGDGHVSFEKSQFMQLTSYRAPITGQKPGDYRASFTPNDNLFASTAAPGMTEHASDSGANALMVWP